MTDAEESLVRRAQKGDHASFEELIRRTSRLVYARLYLELGDRHRTEDLVQETLFTAYRAIGKLADPSQFRSWLLKIAQNVLFDSIRHDRRKKRSAPPGAQEQPLDAMISNSPQPEEALQQAETRQQVLSVLRSLPEEYRLPLTLRYIGGEDYDAIGLQLGLSNGSLRGLLHRGLKLLRTKLQHANKHV